MDFISWYSLTTPAIALLPFGFDVCDHECFDDLTAQYFFCLFVFSPKAVNQIEWSETNKTLKVSFINHATKILQLKILVLLWKTGIVKALKRPPWNYAHLIIKPYTFCIHKLVFYLHSIFHHDNESTSL